MMTTRGFVRDGTMVVEMAVASACLPLLVIVLLLMLHGLLGLFSF